MNLGYVCASISWRMSFKKLNATLLRHCERELEQIESRNFLLEEKIWTKLEVCGDSHIHITVRVGSVVTARYVIRNEDDRRLMHYENLYLVRDVIEDKHVISSTSCT